MSLCWVTELCCVSEEWLLVSCVLPALPCSPLGYLCLLVFSVWFVKSSGCLNRVVQVLVMQVSFHISLHQQFLVEEVTHTVVCAACDAFRCLFLLKQLSDYKCTLAVVHATRLYLHVVGLYSEKICPHERNTSSVRMKTFSTSVPDLSYLKNI